MNDPFRGYDQWKTASPYDDEPDLIDETERCLKEWALYEPDFARSGRDSKHGDVYRTIQFMVELLDRWKEEC